MYDTFVYNAESTVDVCKENRVKDFTFKILTFTKNMEYLSASRSENILLRSMQD